MGRSTANESTDAFVRHLGIGYLLIVFIGLFNTFFVKSGIYNVETFSDTAGWFRMAQAVDLTMYCIVIWVSWSSYMVARTVNRSMSLLALLFRFGEGLLGCVAAIISLMCVVILTQSDRWEAFDVGQLQALTLMFMDLNNMAWDILFVLMGVGASIFMYLFYISRYVPRWLSVWGLFTYLSMLVLGLIRVAVAGVPEQLALIMFPGMFFELTFGLWLTFKGVNAGQSRESGAAPEVSPA